MNPDRAIKIFKYNINTHPQKEDKPFRDALQLGIEALKRLEHGRLLHNRHCQRTLPGETKE